MWEIITLIKCRAFNGLISISSSIVSEVIVNSDVMTRLMTLISESKDKDWMERRGETVDGDGPYQEWVSKRAIKTTG